MLAHLVTRFSGAIGIGRASPQKADRNHPRKLGIYMLKYTRIGLEIYYHSIPVNYLPLLNISAGRRIGCALGQHPGVRRWFPRYGTWTGQLLILIFNFENFF